jgi:hypothetical protein
MLLNPALYTLLKRHFGDVDVKNAGVEMQYDYLYDPVSKRLRLRIINSGEEYAVSCDQCSDTRKRLSINANWYYHDREHGQKWSHLIHCFNEDCYAEHHVRAALYTRLLHGRCSGSLQAPAAKQVAIPVNSPLPTLGLPPGFKRLALLKHSHPAVKYLTDRGFDPEEIDRLYGVGYTKSGEAPQLARRRIIIPSYADGQCVGWQARYVGDADFKSDGAPPKYYTCPGMKRGRVVYNLDQARKYQTIVIVEGPTDVWRVGPMAVAIWGSTLSASQKELLRQRCRDASVVLMLDPEIMDPASDRYMRIKLKNLVGMTETFAGGLATVCLPDGKDPGSLDRCRLRELLEDQASAQGVPVTWTERRQTA